MTTICIPLRVASKKNSRRNYGRISLPSKAYVKFHENAAIYLLPYKRLHFTTPVEIKIVYSIKGKYHQDIDNVVSSVFDCLTDYGIIADDDLCHQVTAVKKPGQVDWLCEINIRELEA